MKKLASPLSNSSHKNVYGYSAIALIAFLFVHSCAFISDGFGTSRVSGYWDQYDGHMSYSEIPARITVHSINENPADTYSWEVLQFGCKLDDQQELIVSIEESAIPKEDIQNIFYNRNSFDTLLKPNTSYWVRLDIRANYYSFLFKRQNGFGIYTWQELKDGETGPVIEPIAHWKTKFIAYAIACWLQAGLFFPAVFFVYDAQTGPRSEKNFAAWLTAIFTVSVGWIIYVDQPFYTNWADYMIPAVGVTLSLAMIVFSIRSFRQTDAPEEDVTI